MTVSETVAKGTASLVVFAAALVVTMAGSWVPSFWYDEAATLQLARLPLPEFFGFVMQRDAVHGLYAFIMHGWIQVFGESEFSVRFPSALAVAVGATGVFHLGRRWFGVAPGILAVVVFVVLPRMTTQGIEARSYAMATALLVVAAVLVARARERRGWAPWIAVTAAATASVWMFAYGLFVLPALALLADDPTLARRTRVLRASAALVVPGLLAVPLVLTMIPQRGQVAWLSGQDVNLYTVLIEPMFGSAFWMVIGLALLVAVAVRAGWRVTLSRPVVSLLVWLLLPGTVLVTLSLAGTPVFTPRYLTVSAPALALLVGSLLGGARRRTLVAASVLICMLTVPHYVASRLPMAKPGGIDLRAAASFIASHARPGDAILLEAAGPAGTRPRVAIAAYPDAFAGLRDIAFASSYVGTGTYSDSLVDPKFTEVPGDADIWVVTRDGSTFAQQLAENGYAPASVRDVGGLTVGEWRRDDAR